MSLKVQHNLTEKLLEHKAIIFVRFCGKLILGLVILALIIGALGFLALKSTLPSSIIREKLIAELHKNFGQTTKISVGDIKLDGGSTIVLADVQNVIVRSATDEKIMLIPSTRVEFKTSDLIKLDFNPTGVTLTDSNISVVVAANGQVAFAASKNSGELISAQESLKRLFSVLDKKGNTPDFQIPRISLENGRVEIEDQRIDGRYVLARINMDVEPESDGKNAVTLRARGQSGDIRAKLMSGTEPLSFNLVIDRISIADIAAFSGLDIKTLSRDMALSLNIMSSWSQDAILKKVEGKVFAGSGKIVIDDPEAAPIEVTEANLDFSYLSDNKKIILSELHFDAGGIDMKFKGEISPSVTDQSWSVHLDLISGILKPLTAQDKAIKITKSSLDALVIPASRLIKLQSFDLVADQLNSLLKGEITFDEKGRMGLAADLTLERSDVRNMLHIWPAFVASKLRDNLVLNLSAGMVTKAYITTKLSAEIFENMKLRKPMPAESVSGDFTINNARFAIVPGVPPLSDVSLNGRATGRLSSLTSIKGEMKLASGKVLAMNEGSFNTPDLAKHPIEAINNFKLTGPLEGIIELLNYPALKGVVPAGEKNTIIKGVFDGQVQISLPLKDMLSPSDVTVQVKANLQNFVIENFLGKENFDSPSLQFSAQTGSMSLKGEGKAAGIPARIDLVQPRSGNQEDGAVTFTLDEAARVKRGINLAPHLNGPVSVLVKADFPVNIKAGLPVEVDLSKANIDGLLPGWVKAAGKASKLKLTLFERENGYKLNNIELDGNGPTLKGSVELGQDGSLSSFQLSQLALSHGDAMQVDGQKTANGLKISVRANSFDARPFLRDASKGTTSSTKDLDLDLKAVALSGFNGEIAANADLRLLRKGNQIKQGSFSAKLNGVSVVGKITPRPDGEATVSLLTQNAGAMLRFADIYSHMQGGALDMRLTKSGTTETGYVNIREFALRDEPALKRASAAANSNTLAEQGVKRGLVSDASDVAFTKLHMDFSRKGSYFDVSDAVMWGSEVGGTLNGQLDYSKDYVNITGTFVPAYGLNNAFAKIPVLGLFLAGNKYEGVFSVPFQITGRASQPNLSINPIAAVSPGFLRKIFDFKGASAPAISADVE